jgi:Na+-transporting methylmalonyl-CoA/oxaloacetate decarboxylase gamma subunit
MNSATVFRFLFLMILVVWVVIRLLPAEHPRYGNLRTIAPQAQEHQSRKVEQGMTERDQVTSDKFANHESLFQAHYHSHFAASGYNYDHYRLAYKYGFDLALDPDHQKMAWNSVEPQARQNWNDGIMGLWSQHREAVLYGWEQGVKINGG